MDYRPKLKTEPEVNLIDIIWGLLSQWKAVVVVSVIMALLLTGFKFHKDNNAYKASLKKQEEIASMTELPPEEQISSVLDSLSEEDRLGVEYVINQKEWVAKEQRYLRDSILLNSNPTDQRTLVLNYHIKSAEESDTALTYGYVGFANSEDLIAALQQIISPESESNIIAELISVKNNYSDGITRGDDSVLEIKIVLPEDVDAHAVEKAVTDEIEKYSDTISKGIGEHEINLISASEARLYNQYAVDRRTNLNTSTYNMNYNLGNLESALSEQQRVAMNSILEIRRQANKAENAVQEVEEKDTAEISKPGISKKYAVLGFLMGIILYAIGFILYSALKGNITSAAQTEHYSDSRLLGEVYYKGARKGLQGLLHSRVIDGIRSNGKKDTSTQISKITSAIDAVCRRNKAGMITVMCLPGLSDEDHAVVSDLESAVKGKGIDVETVDVDFATIEEKLLCTDYVACVTGENVKAADLINLTSLMKAYDTKNIGNIFIQCI